MAESAFQIIEVAVQLFSAALYFWVARIVLERGLEGETKRANMLFGVWWIALGLVFVSSPLLTILPSFFGYRDLALSVALLNAVLLLIVVAVWGLVYYLTYIYTGSPRAFWPITAFYALLAFALLYLIAWMDPNGFDDSGALTFEHRQLSGAPGIGLGLVFSLPVVIAAVAYGSLFFRVKGRPRRYRIALVSTAFLVQFGWSTLSAILQLSSRYPDSVVLPLLSNGLGILAAITILLAFRPPRVLRKRLGLPGAEGA